MGDRRYLLTGVEFEVLWTELGDTPPPAVLRLGLARPHPRGAPAGARRGRAGAARPRVGRRAPARIRGWSGCCTSLARPAQQLELRARWGEPLRAVAAARDGSRRARGAARRHRPGHRVRLAAGGPARCAPAGAPGSGTGQHGARPGAGRRRAPARSCPGWWPRGFR